MKRLLAFLPWFTLFFGFAVMVGLYPQLPPQWAIHYDGAGHPNGWAPKSISSAFFPLFMALGVTVMMELIGQVAIRVGARLPTAGGEAVQARMQECNLVCLRLISSALALFMSYLAWCLPFAQGPGFILGPVVGLLAVVIVGPLVCLRSAYRELRQSGLLAKGYRGAYYYDVNDPRIWVPKLMGAGWTLNFAHKQAWLWMILLVGLPLALVLAAVKIQP